MNDQLIIRISTEIGELTAKSVAQWVLFDTQGDLVSTDKTPIENISSAVENMSNEHDVVIIVPGFRVLLCEASIPSKKLSQIKQALPFMVEEMIAEEIENVHIAIPDHLDLNTGKVDVAVISHQILINYLDIFYSNKLSPIFITPDTLAVPFTRNSYSVVIEGNQCVVRTNELSGINASSGDMEMVLASLLGEKEKNNLSDNDALEKTVEVVTNANDDEGKVFGKNVANHIRENFGDVTVKESLYRESVTELIATTFVRNLSNPQSHKTINILQGGYQINSQQAGSWQHWKKGVSAMAVGVLAIVILSLSNGWYFSKQASEFDQKSIALYKDLFPNERRVVSPRKQLENHLRQANNTQSSGTFLNLLTKISESLSSPELRSSLTSSKIVIQKLRYDQNVDGIQLEIQTDSIDQLDQIKKRLGDIGLTTKVNSATEQDTYVLSRVLVERI
ncbi:MAG: general secretion pathway protein L [Gammaproteobacteria bacterium]|jgi:general secretion pathway protein L